MILFLFCFLHLCLFTWLSKIFPSILSSNLSTEFFHLCYIFNFPELFDLRPFCFYSILGLFWVVWDVISSIISLRMLIIWGFMFLIRHDVKIFLVMDCDFLFKFEGTALQYGKGWNQYNANPTKLWGPKSGLKLVAGLPFKKNQSSSVRTVLPVTTPLPSPAH